MRTPGQQSASPIPLNDFVAQWREIRADATAAVERVGESGWLVLGREVSAFEAELASHAGLSHAVGCANGLDALEISLRALGIAPGDRVLTTPLSAFATTLAVVRAGGVPVFVDVDASGLLDLDACARLLDTRRDVRFLLPVHLYGHALDLARLAALRRIHDLRVVEDCAQAIGARSRGAPVGSVGSAAGTSFYPTKNLGCMGDGGAVLTNDRALADAARCLRDYGQSAKYVHSALGLNSRLDELQAAILRSALLPRLDRFTARRRDVAAAYREGLRNPALVVPPAPAGSESVWHLFPVLVEGERARFKAHLDAAGVGSGLHYPTLIPDQEALAGVPAEVVGALPNARRFAEREISLPIHPYLEDRDVARVVDACNGWRP
jgi:dTDP-3-amino-3,4,6-trideoxy-alpha-D-glucose transaminase